MWQKLAAVLVMIVSAIGFLLCLAILLGAWLFNEPATQAITETLDVVDGYLSVAEETIDQVDSRLVEIQSNLDALANISPERVAEARESVAQKVGPAVTQVKGAVDGLQSTIAAAGQMLDQLERLPGLRTSSFGDELQNLDQRIAEMSDKFNDLTTALANQDFDGARIMEAASAMSAQLAQVHTALEAFIARINSVRASLVPARAAVPEQLDTASIIVMIVVLLLGAGQVSLFIHGLNWFRMEDPQFTALE